MAVTTKNEHTSGPDRLLTVKEAAQVLAVSPRFLYARLATGEIDRVKLGNRTRVRWSDVQRLMHEGSR